MNTISNNSRDLNPEQLEAVCHRSGQLLIFAGAGSGKTRVLTQRIARLVSEGEATPREILAVTFTNKAAREMKHRISDILENSVGEIWVSTFHSICARILRSHAQSLGYRIGFSIYDTGDSLAAMKRAYAKVGIDPKLISPKGVLSQIDRLKNNYVDPDSYREKISSFDEHASTIADLYSAYQDELFKANAMDFGDLLCNTLSLLRLNSSICEHYQNRFRHILVDEYQDTNRVQYLLIKLLAGHHKNLCVVGDDDQSIYAFRGATIDNILSFQKDYPAAKVITLNINYRSTKTILEAANAVISKNEKRAVKSMRTENNIGSKIKYFVAEDEQDEANWVVSTIQQLVAANHSAKDIAIFYRTNSQSRAMEEALCSAGIAYEIFGGQKFYDRKEVKDILAYLRLSLNHDDDESFLRIINTPTRGIGNTTVAELAKYAKANQLPLLAALKKVLSEREAILPKAALAKCSNFISTITRIVETVQKANLLLSEHSGSIDPSHVNQAIANVLEFIAEETGYLAVLRKQDTEESVARIENIYELCNVAVAYVRNVLEEEKQVDFFSFLDRVGLVSDSDVENRKTVGEQTEPGSISLMTLHLAKGLEFENVFLVGLEEGLLPHVRSFDTRSEIEEERRLCYVGITRAKSSLFLSSASSRESFGKSSWCSGIPSRFLADIPERVLEYCSNSARQVRYNWR